MGIPAPAPLPTAHSSCTPTQYLASTYTHLVILTASALLPQCLDVLRAQDLRPLMVLVESAGVEPAKVAQLLGPLCREVACVPRGGGERSNPAQQ